MDKAVSVGSPGVKDRAYVCGLDGSTAVKNALLYRSEKVLPFEDRKNYGKPSPFQRRSPGADFPMLFSREFALRGKIFLSIASADDLKVRRQLNPVGPMRRLKQTPPGLKRNLEFHQHGLHFACAGHEHLVGEYLDWQMKIAHLEGHRDGVACILQADDKSISFEQIDDDGFPAGSASQHIAVLEGLPDCQQEANLNSTAGGSAGESLPALGPGQIEPINEIVRRSGRQFAEVCNRGFDKHAGYLSEGPGV
jgi:hypothetical protein